MKPTFREKNEKLISMNNDETNEILTALEYRIEHIEENIKHCKKYSPDLVEYWEKRRVRVQNVYKSFRRKVYPNLEVV